MLLNSCSLLVFSGAFLKGGYKWEHYSSWDLTRVSFRTLGTGGSLSFSFISSSLSLSSPLSLRVAILCLFLRALQSLPLDWPCHMGSWPHTPLDVFVAVAEAKGKKKNTRLMLSLVCMLRQQFFFVVVVSCCRAV